MTNVLNKQSRVELASRVEQLVESGLDKQWAVLERCAVLAEYFNAHRTDEKTTSCHTLDSTLSAFAGLALADCVPLYLKLYEHLMTQPYGADSAYEFGTDAYVYPVAERTVEDPFTLKFPELKFNTTPRPISIKAFVLETQSRNYLIVLRKQSTAWEVHIRRFWKSLAVAKASDKWFLLDEYAGRNDLTLEDVVALASQAAEYYSDDMPGVSNVTRPSLLTLLSGSLNVGENDAGVGLLYADGRDPGYVASISCNLDVPNVKDIGWYGLSELTSVMFNLASAIDCLDIVKDTETGAGEDSTVSTEESPCVDSTDAENAVNKGFVIKNPPLFEDILKKCVYGRFSSDASAESDKK